MLIIFSLQSEYWWNWQKRLSRTVSNTCNFFLKQRQQHQITLLTLEFFYLDSPLCRFSVQFLTPFFRGVKNCFRGKKNHTMSDEDLFYGEYEVLSGGSYVGLGKKFFSSELGQINASFSFWFIPRIARNKSVVLGDQS